MPSNWFTSLASRVVIKARLRKMNFPTMEMTHTHFKFKVKTLIKDNIES